ncbi:MULTISPECIES: homoserine dehydrogenase [unclassified Nitratiruptor]|uniref:homoserine dehydrogenase n=1 Tax=unclassified Nitratiruptor TaxID=2624044 RepID=UPI001915E69C|nr:MULTISPECIES: homoserine dehydrogenase [unclassified Nitratiruptor]BCD60856.1 homoserine dehydrogenase [Nitratiruptor sp. YY08-10]BCD64788.1 homoserine dehydrogenase [Nitratiruptor sp. YY08-14]
MIKVGIIGVGTVGTSVVQVLEKNRDIISARAGKEIQVVKGVVRNLEKKRNINIPLTTDPFEVTDDPNIDIVVELMGGVEEAYEVVQRALKNKKAVVTANKALLAYHRYELQQLAGDIPFEFEASVAGGIPIIKALREGLSANHIDAIRGIMNGTCNYILTKMANEGAEFSTILKESQELGYAEADPTFDIEGYDAAHKLLILASIAYGIDAKPEDILIEGITKINTLDFEFANEFGYSIKLLTIAKKRGNEVELRVHPTLVPNEQMIAKVDGVMNGVSVIGDVVGETMYYGPGAGGDATASAVVSNIIDIARGGKCSPMLGFKRPLESGMILASKDSILSNYYLRLLVEDRPGILAKIASIFGEYNISIESMLQKPGPDKLAHLLLSTHQCKESEIHKALNELKQQAFLKEEPAMIRIEV